MTHTLILFDQYDAYLGSHKALMRAVCLEAAGHNVQEFKHETSDGPLSIKMWIDFETEEEAALFKLTYL